MADRGKPVAIDTLEAYNRLVAGSMSEDTLLSRVLEMARLAGWMAYHIRNSRAGIVQGAIGFPDLCLARGDRLLFAELKSEKGKVSAAQDRWLSILGGTPAEVYVWRPSDFLTGKCEEVLR